MHENIYSLRVFGFDAASPTMVEKWGQVCQGMAYRDLQPERTVASRYRDLFHSKKNYT